jgi:outer membrane protein OmpA-like peptidoglycan-associated protein
MTTSNRRAGNWPLLVAAVLLIPLFLFVLGVFDDEPTGLGPDGATGTPTPAATPTPDDDPAPPVRSDPDQEIPADAPREVAATVEAGLAGEFTELRAILRGGRLHLIGAVTDAATAQDMVALGSGLVGDDAVLDFMVIDERVVPPEAPVLRTELPVRFETDSAVIAARSEGLVDDVATSLVASTMVAVEVVGHTDDRGDDIANLDLSLRRAQAVVDRLVAAGVDRGRLTASGRGETRPVADNDADRGRARNNRIEIVVSPVGV